jgi:hypothetical protein
VRYTRADFVDVLMIVAYIANILMYVGLRIGKLAMVLGFNGIPQFTVSGLVSYLCKFSKVHAQWF